MNRVPPPDSFNKSSSGGEGRIPSRQVLQCKSRVLQALNGHPRHMSSDFLTYRELPTLVGSLIRRSRENKKLPITKSGVLKSRDRKITRLFAERHRSK